MVQTTEALSLHFSHDSQLIFKLPVSLSRENKVLFSRALKKTKPQRRFVKGCVIRGNVGGGCYR